MRERPEPKRRPSEGPRRSVPRCPIDPVRDRVTGLVASMVATFPDLPLGADFDAFEGRDAAFAYAMHDAVLRRWLTLEFLIGLGLDRPLRSLEPGLQAVLLVGAAQMVLLDKVPPHAAIDQSVHIAKARIRVGAGGLVNAVLRRVSELCGERGPRGDDWRKRLDAVPLADGRSLQLTRACLPPEEVKRASVLTSTPKPLLDKWARAFGLDAASEIALKGIGSAPTILNTEACPEAARAMVQDGLLSPHRREHAFVWRGDRSKLAAALERSGAWVQDPASAEVVRTVAAAAGTDAAAAQLVVDLCAGQGTKTRQLLRAFPNATVIACEVDGERLATLERVFAREPRVRIVHAQHTPRACQDGGVGVADVVLLDVPCGNSGVLSRRVEARYRLGGAALEELVGIQREILRTGHSLLRPGGLLAYSTCSLEHEENEAQRDFMIQTLGCVPMVDRRTTPAGVPGQDAALFHDGSFVAVGRLPV